jgi:hypothetical protein
LHALFDDPTLAIQVAYYSALPRSITELAVWDFVQEGFVKWRTSRYVIHVVWTQGKHCILYMIFNLEPSEIKFLLILGNAMASQLFIWGRTILRVLLLNSK